MRCEFGLLEQESKRCSFKRLVKSLSIRLKLALHKRSFIAYWYM